MLIDVGRSFRLTPAQQFRKILLPAALPSMFVGLRLGLIFAMINIVGVEFLINFGGLGQLINELAERYDLPGTYGAICFVMLVSIVFFDVTGRHRAMAAAERVTGKSGAASWRAVALLRIAIIAFVALAWEMLAASGLLFRDVVPVAGRDRTRGVSAAGRRRLLSQSRRSPSAKSLRRSRSAASPAWASASCSARIASCRALTSR